MEMNEEKLQEMIGEAVKAQTRELETKIEALKAKPAEENKKESADKRKNVDKGRDDAAGRDEDQKKPAPDPEVESLKTGLKEVQGQVGEIIKALGLDTSKAIKGQEPQEMGKVIKKDFGGRDGFGRKRAKKGER